MSTKIRAVSDLAELTNTPNDDDLIEVSHTNDGSSYSSKKYKYESLMNDVSAKSIEVVQNKWGIEDVGDISETVDYVAALSAKIGFSGGPIAFYRSPMLMDGGQKSNSQNAFQTRSQIYDDIQQYSSYLTPGSYIDGCDPKNDSGYTHEYQYMWKIENGEYDSSLAYDEDGFQYGGIQITSTGCLVIYGWLASNANVAPQNAWVGLYTLIGEKWVLVQVQPWIMSQHSQMMQYVGFNIMVRAGSQFKIMTGFPVNGNNSGFQTYTHNLMPSAQGNSVNTFIGYVIQN